VVAGPATVLHLRVAGVFEVVELDGSVFAVNFVERQHAGAVFGPEHVFRTHFRRMVNGAFAKGAVAVSRNRIHVTGFAFAGENLFACGRFFRGGEDHRGAEGDDQRCDSRDFEFAQHVIGLLIVEVFPLSELFRRLGGSLSGNFRGGGRLVDYREDEADQPEQEQNGRALSGANHYLSKCREVPSNSVGRHE